MEWWGWLVATLGAIVLIGNAIKAAREILAPAVAMEGRLKKVEEHDKKDNERFAEIEQRMRERDAEQETTNQAILKGLVALINHEIDGNGIEGLRKTRNTLLEQIIER